MYLCFIVHLCALQCNTCRGQKRSLDPQELEIQMVVMCPYGGAGNYLRSLPAEMAHQSPQKNWFLILCPAIGAVIHTVFFFYYNVCFHNCSFFCISNIIYIFIFYLVLIEMFYNLNIYQIILLKSGALLFKDIYYFSL